MSYPNLTLSDILKKVEGAEWQQAKATYGDDECFAGFYVWLGDFEVYLPKRGNEEDTHTLYVLEKSAYQQFNRIGMGVTERKPLLTFCGGKKKGFFRSLPDDTERALTDLEARIRDSFAEKSRRKSEEEAIAKVEREREIANKLRSTFR